MLLLSFFVETGQCPGAGLTQADKTCIQLNFYLEILKGGTWVSRGGQKPPNCNPGNSVVYYSPRFFTFERFFSPIPVLQNDMSLIPLIRGKTKCTKENHNLFFGI